MVKFVRKTCLAALLLLSTCASPTNADLTSNQKADAAPKLFRVMVYTEEFARRFELSRAGVYTLDKGLQALAIRIVEPAGQPPRCHIDLYLDDSLDLDYPDGSEGMRNFDDEKDPLFFVKSVEALGSRSSRWLRRRASFHATACAQNPQSCLVSEGTPDAFSRHLLDGLAFQAHSEMCTMFDPHDGPLEMWLLKAGRDPSALFAQSTDESATYRFAIPSALIAAVAKRAKHAALFFEKPLPPAPESGHFSVPGGK